VTEMCDQCGFLAGAPEGLFLEAGHYT